MTDDLERTTLVQTAALLRTLAVAVTFGCAARTTEPLPDGGRRVLFIGNSLTYTHDLPQTIAEMAQAVNDTPLV